MQNNEKLKISTSTYVRFICLSLALINQVLSAFGKPIIPIEDKQIETFVTVTITIATAFWGWWKNNSVTQEALRADVVMKMLKAEKGDK